jgi:hypothetical protein
MRTSRKGTGVPPWMPYSDGRCSEMPCPAAHQHCSLQRRFCLSHILSIRRLSSMLAHTCHGHSSVQRKNAGHKFERVSMGRWDYSTRKKAAAWWLTQAGHI